MYLVRILKRKDASSVLVAVVLAMIMGQLLPYLTSQLSGLLAGLDDNQYVSYVQPGSDWKVHYLQPVLTALLQILVLELLARLYVAVTGMAGTSSKRRRA